MYGCLEDIFGVIVCVWSVWLGVMIMLVQVCILLVDMKICCVWGNLMYVDNWVDLVGYVVCGGELVMKGDVL